MNFNEILTVSLSLFAVIDILGSIPVLVSMKEKMGHVHSEKVTLVSGAIMIGFLFVGQGFLSIMGLDIRSFALAGAVVIFIVAMEMILERDFFRQPQGGNAKTGNIVPIAFPLIAGAGTLTTLMSLRSKYEETTILIAIGINLVIIYAVLKTMGVIERVLGSGGIAILRRVFGVILLAVAIKLFTGNLFPQAEPTGHGGKGQSTAPHPAAQAAPPAAPAAAADTVEK